MTKTIMKKNAETQHEWYLIDVTDKVVGRAATKIATLLKGKHKVDFTPHVDNGGGVIVLNCCKAKVTGKKHIEKMYKRFSGYPRGQKETPYQDMMVKNPTYALRHAIKGMLPKTKIGDKMIKRLKLYTGEVHPHTAQKPTIVKI